MLLLSGCGKKDVNQENQEPPAETQRQTFGHTPDDVLKTGEKLIFSNEYDLIFTGDSVRAYNSGEIIAEILLGEATYEGFSYDGQFLFLMDNTLLGITYRDSAFIQEVLGENIRDVLDPMMQYEEGKYGIFAETVDGETVLRKEEPDPAQTALSE